MDEVRSLAAMLRQSIELGADVGDALRAFSDHVRDRRLLWAEERAKMVGPLSLFIFPVILGIAMLPGIIRLITVLNNANRHITGDSPSFVPEKMASPRLGYGQPEVG
jgi:pilus assembly protein TadC